MAAAWLPPCSAVHVSGALLLELKDGDLYDRQLCSTTVAPAPAGGGARPQRPDATGPCGYNDDEDDGAPDHAGYCDDGGDIDLPDADDFAPAADGGAGAEGDAPDWLQQAPAASGAGELQVGRRAEAQRPGLTVFDWQRALGVCSWLAASSRGRGSSPLA